MIGVGTRDMPGTEKLHDMLGIDSVVGTGEREWVGFGDEVVILLRDGWQIGLGSMSVERGREVMVAVLRRQRRKMRKREGLVGPALVVGE